MTNGVDKNEIIAFRRNDDGTLQQTRTFETDGRGSGGNVDPLGSQGSLVLSQDRSHLFALNAGSGELSVFRVQGDLLSLDAKVISGGSEPVAVTQHADLVYVVNAGGNGNVVGFRWDYGKLTEIPGSTRFLTASNSVPGSIAFSPDGKFVAVTEKQTSKLDVFRVQADGTLSPAVVTPSAGSGGSRLVSPPTGQRWFPKPAPPAELTRRRSLPTRFLPADHSLRLPLAFPPSERQPAGRWPLQTAALSTHRTPARLQSPDFRSAPMGA